MGDRHDTGTTAGTDANATANGAAKYDSTQRGVKEGNAVPPRPRRRSEFLRGLRCVNPLVLVAAAVLTAIVLLASQQAVMGRAYRVLDERYLLRSPKDDYTHITYLIASLRADPPTRLPVYYIGGSATRESIRSGPAFASALAAQTGVQTAVYVLGSKQQTLAETLAIIDNLPKGPGVAVVGLNPARFRVSPQESALQLRGVQFLLPSPSLRAYIDRTTGLAMADRTLIPGIANYVSSWLRFRRGSLTKLRLAKIQYEVHLFNAANQLSDQQKAENAALVRKAVLARPTHPDATTRYNLGLLAAIATAGETRGLQVVFMEAPRNREMLGSTWQLDRQTYTPPVAAAAKRAGAAYLDLNTRIEIPNEQFADLSHLLEPGRIVWEHGLADALAPVVERAQAALRATRQD